MSIQRLACFVSSTVLACGGSLDVPTGPTPDAGVPTDAPSSTGPVGQPPPPTTTGVPPSTQSMTFVFNQIFLGESGRDGTVMPGAWKSFGYNIDGKVTTKASTDVCTREPAAAPVVQEDGNLGIDNSWGQNLLPIVQSVAGLPTPSKTITDGIVKGARTNQISILGLSSDPAQTSMGLTASMYRTSTYPAGSAPAFDLTTDWPVAPDEVVDGKTIASGAVHAFPNAYTTSGTFVNDANGNGTITWSLPFGGSSWALVIRHPIVTLDHSAPGKAANGTIAGVINAEEAIASLKTIAGNISPSLCLATTFNAIAAQISQAVDILDDGTNVAGKPCSAISIGIGFSGVQIANPTMVTADPTKPNPCQ